MKNKWNISGFAGSSRTLAGAFAPEFVNTWLVGAHVVGGCGGNRMKPPTPGNQSQRPSPSHRTHDTTDQWREFVGG